MPPSRWTLAFALLLGASPVGCPPTVEPQPVGSQGPDALGLGGFDAASLTPREQREWRSYLDELLAPCAEVAVSVAACVARHHPCAACEPAARFVLQQVRAGRPKSQVFDLYEARFDPGRIRTLVVGDSAARGPVDAPVTIVEFADFECPSCRRMAAVLDEVLVKFPREVRLVFKHYPISYHLNAHLAARAAVAAQLQGQFWPMLHTCFAHAERLGEADLKRYAAELGLDLGRFEQDLHAEAVHRQVDRERKQGDGLGLKGTPTLYVNGREVPLGLLEDPLRDLTEWIGVELELARRAAEAGRASSAAPPSAAPPPAPPDGGAGGAT